MWIISFHFFKKFFSQVESETQVESSLYFGSEIKVESSLYFGSEIEVETCLYSGSAMEVESSLYFGVESKLAVTCNKVVRLTDGWFCSPPLGK